MAIKIRTAAVTGHHKVEYIDLETPDLRRSEALVRVKAVALCTLEQRIFQGEVRMPLPCTGGHEVAGEIVALGDGANLKRWSVGDRVVVRLLYNCGECHYCKSGFTNMCELALKKPVREGLLIGPGGLCDYLIADTRSLFRIPDHLTFEEASLTEPLACCVHSVERADLKLGEDVVVIGGGIMGQYHIMLAKRKGCRVILSEMDPKRRALAEQLGADLTVDPSQCDPVEFVRGLTDSRGADVVFNTTAIPSVVPQAIAMVGKRGRMIQYSSMHPDEPVPVSPQMLHSTEITLTGAISPDETNFYTANRLLSSGILSSKPLIEKTFPFEKAQQAFEAAILPGTFRIIITNE